MKDNKLMDRSNVIQLQIHLVKVICRSAIPVILLLMGVVVLVLRIPGWSLFLGLPLVVLGAVFTVYTYDHLVSKSLGDYTNLVTKCVKCRRPTPHFKGQDPKSTLCPVCVDER